MTRTTHRAEISPYDAWLQQADPPRAPPHPAGHDRAISTGSSAPSSTRDLRLELNDERHENAYARNEHRLGRNRHEEVGVGCLALVPELRQVTLPRNFEIDIDQYNGFGNPEEYLQLYSVAASSAGADELLMAYWFPLTLRGDARTRMLNLP